MSRVCFLCGKRINNGHSQLYVSGVIYDVHRDCMPDYQRLKNRRGIFYE